MFQRNQPRKTYGLAAAVACLLIVGALEGAEAPVVGRLVSKTGTVLERGKAQLPQDLEEVRKLAQSWKTVPDKGEIHAEAMVLGLPYAVIEDPKGAVRLIFLTNIAGNALYPIREAAVILHATADHDLDFTLNRGRVDVTNTKKEGAVKVRIRFHDQQWEAKLTEPGTRIVLQLYGRWAKGVPFHAKPNPKDVPAADLLLLVRQGQVELKHGSCYHLMSAAPGPALLHWDNGGGHDEAPQQLEKLPDWAFTEQSESERAQTLRKNIEDLRQKIIETSPNEAARAFVTSEDASHRRCGLVLLGALDDLEGLGEVINHTKYHDTWDRAVVIVRHWLGRCPGQDQILYQALLSRRGLKEAHAKGVMQLLHSFGDETLAHPELYTALVRYLDSDVLGIRGLAHWHLERLVPDGKKFDFNPLDPKDKRDQARDKWKKLIDDLIAAGKLPPKDTHEEVER